MSRHFEYHRDRSTAVLLLLCLALAGCADDDSQARIEALRDSLATVNSENSSLRASSRVLETRLAATRIAARTAGTRLQEVTNQLAQLSAREAALSRAHAQDTQRLRAAESAIAHYEGQLAGGNQALGESEARNAALSQQLAALSGWLGQRDALGQSQDNTLKSMEEDLQRRTSSLESLRTQLASEKESLQRASAEAKRLRARNARLDAQLKTLQTTFEDMSAQSSQRIAELEKSGEDLAADAAQRVAAVEREREKIAAQASERVAAAEREREKIAAQASERVAAVEREREKVVAQAEQRVAALERERDALSARLRNAQGQTQTVQTNATQLSENNEQFKARMESLRSELADANDRALRYQVAKDYLVDKVQAQEATIDGLKKAAAEARSQHKATVATMLGQHDALRAAAQRSAETSQKALAHSEVLQKETARLGAQLKQAQLDLSASEQRARDVKRAKDYLDGKLADTMKELDDARDEHRVARLKIEHALALSLEESRVWQQRERELREQLRLTQQSSGEKLADLRVRLATSKQEIDSLKARSSKHESTLAQLKTRNARQLDELREQLDATASAQRDALQVKLAAAQQANAMAQTESRACSAARKEDSAAIRDLEWGNKTLHKEIETLEDRLRILEAVQNECTLQKTAL